MGRGGGCYLRWSIGMVHNLPDVFEVDAERQRSTTQRHLVDVGLRGGRGNAVPRIRM